MYLICLILKKSAFLNKTKKKTIKYFYTEFSKDKILLTDDKVINTMKKKKGERVVSNYFIYLYCENAHYY